MREDDSKVMTTEKEADYIPSVSPADFIPSVSPADFIPSVSPADFIPSVSPADFIPSVSPADFIPSVSPGEDNQIRGTPELMNVSPATDCSPDQCSDNSNLDLLRQHEWLIAQKHQLEVQLLANRPGRNEDIDKMTEEQLKMLHDKLNAELIEKTCLKDSRELILQGERLQQLTSSILFPEHESQVENWGQKRELEVLMEELADLSVTVAQGYKENSELRDELEILRKQNFELLVKSRQMYGEINSKKMEKEQELKALTTDKKGKSAHENLQTKLQKNIYLRNILQGLILGSGLNWAEDENLQNLVLKAGRNVQI